MLNNSKKFSQYQLFIIYMMLMMIVIPTFATDRDQNKRWLLEAVKAYADAMIENGRDVYGEKHSPLFAAALERKPMGLGTLESFGSIPGVRANDRSLAGANPQEDMALYKIFYELTRITGDEKYASEADKALEYFFKHCQSPETSLMAWGEHLYWDFYEEACRGTDMHEIEGEWPFWDQSYKLAPEASWRYALGLWDHQVHCKETGDFSRHARWSVHGTFGGFEFPRYAGQMILNWADAYSREENAHRKRRGELLNAISVIVGRMEANTKLAESGYLPAGRAEAGDHVNVVWLGSNLELARCLWKAAPQILKSDKDLAVRMQNLALKQDLDFHKTPHQISTGGGFAVTLHSKTGEPRFRSMNNPYTAVWATGYGHSTHANLANLCYARYNQLLIDHPEVAEKYRRLILAAAEQYLSATPDTGQLQKPDALASVIELMINAFNITGEEKFIKRAGYFSQIGADLFLNDGLPLPKATNQHSHYEAITGGPGFIYALLQLYSQF
jgi:hypothetical protein